MHNLLMQNSDKQKIHPVRAIAALTILAVISIFVSVAILLWNLREKELEHAKVEAESIARMLVEQTSQALNSVDLILDGVQERLQSSYGEQLPLNSPTVHLLLAARIASTEQVRVLFLVDREGVVVNSSKSDSATVGNSVRDRAFFQVLASGKSAGLYIGHPVRGHRDSVWRMHFARRLTDGNGNFRGIAVISLNLSYFEKLYDLTKLDMDRPIALYMDDGTLIASTPHRDAEIGQAALELTKRREISQNQGIHFFALPASNGDINTYAQGRLKGLPLWISVKNDQDEALASWREISVPIGMGALVVSLIIIFVAFILVAKLRRETQLTQALFESDQRYRLTIDSVRDAIVGVNDENCIVLFNPEAEKMFGYPAEQILGTSLDKLIPENNRQGHYGYLKQFSVKETTQRIMAPERLVAGLRADGSEFLIESSISQTSIGGMRQFTAVLRDVTERQRREEQLREMNQQLRNMSTTLEEVREGERRRIAHELHDELGQQLTGLKLELSWLSNRIRDGRSNDASDVDSMGRLLDDALASVRRISSELRPKILDDLGFGEAVRYLAQETARRVHLQIRIDLPAADLIDNEKLATGLYRIVQESLTNIARHAKASEVSISLIEDSSGMLRLTISDNGQGFQDGQSGNIGLAGMCERAKALGGKCQVVNHLGVTVNVIVPHANVEMTGVVA